MYITGRAGTGKSTFLKYRDKIAGKNIVKLAPTGVAAINAGGQTLHSFFKIRPSVYTPDDPRLKSRKEQTEEGPNITDYFHYNLTRLRTIRGIETIVIDEISMVRIDVFEMIMQILDFAATKGQNIRLIVVGDFGQLAPVCTSSDKAVLKTLYPDIKGYYAFNSAKWHKANFEKIVLHKVFRQKDAELIEHLNGIKYGRYSDLEWFKYNASPFMSYKPVYICSRRKTVDEFNQSAIEEYSKENPTTIYQAK
jgi:hypothetical protein